MNKEYKKVVVVGNGMDLDHKAPTSYKDIFGGCPELSSNSDLRVAKVDDIVRDAIADRWTDFENTLKKVTRVWKAAFMVRDKQVALSEDESKMACDLALDMLNLMNESKFWQKINTCKTNEEILHVIEQLDEANNYVDLSYVLIKILGSYIQNLLDSFDIKKQDKYVEYFANALVINYNYTSWYEGIYYDKNDAVYIHGRIDANSKYNEIDPSSKTKNVFDILLGYYNDNLPLHTLKVSKDFNLLNIEDALYERTMNLLLLHMGMSSLDFNKNINFESSANDCMGFEPIKKKINSSTIEELTFIGHSLSENDLEPLFRKIFNSNGTKIHVKQLTIIGAWKSQEGLVSTEAKLEEMNLMSWDNINFINNTPL